MTFSKVYPPKSKARDHQRDPPRLPGSNTLRTSQTTMSLKRQNTSSPEADEDAPPTKRQRPSWVDEFETFKHPTVREQPRVDISSGQQSAFPGLDDDNDELIYGDPEDGVQYLRMVRSERKNVPHILVAETEPQASFADNGDDHLEDEDYHPDRAWISAPDEINYEALDSSPDAQDLYYLALLNRFAELQTLLRLPAPLSTIELLTSTQPISFPPDAAKAREKWRHVTKTSDPHPTQLACMDPESVMELLKLLTECMSGIMKSRVQMRVQRLGGWIWATLARCRDRGELSSEEVAELRELGKRAVQLLDYSRRSQGVEVGIQTAIYDDEAIDVVRSTQVEGEGGSCFEAAAGLNGSGRLEASSGDLTELEQAKANMTSMLEGTGREGAMHIAEEGTDDAEERSIETGVDKQIRMVLDTTLTIVGEVYGQRDLLEHRDIWD